MLSYFQICFLCGEILAQYLSLSMYVCRQHRSLSHSVYFLYILIQSHSTITMSFLSLIFQVFIIMPGMHNMLKRCLQETREIRCVKGRKRNIRETGQIEQKLGGGTDYFWLP